MSAQDNLSKQQFPKVTTPHVEPGMTVRSPYLGNGKDFYEIESMRVEGEGRQKAAYVKPKGHSRNHPAYGDEYAFNMNSKFEVRD